MAEKIELPPFTVRKGETEDEARKRWIRSLSVDELREAIRRNLPWAKQRVERANKIGRKRQKAG
jgi:hypothetical protein